MSGLGLKRDGESRHRLSRALAAGGAADPRPAAAGSRRAGPNAANWPRSRRAAAQGSRQAAKKAAASSTAEDEAVALKPDGPTPGADDSAAASADAAIRRAATGKDDRAGDRMSAVGTRLQGRLFQLESLFGKRQDRSRRSSTASRARQPDRAAGRLSDAVAGAALWLAPKDKPKATDIDSGRRAARQPQAVTPSSTDADTSQRLAVPVRTASSPTGPSPGAKLVPTCTRASRCSSSSRDMLALASKRSDTTLRRLACRR